MENTVAVKCVNLEKKYFLFKKDFKVIPWLVTKKGTSEERIPLTSINLTINKGDVIGFIGKNGAGKSTLMKIIAGITTHTSGSLEVNGKVNSLINLSAGFNQKYTGRENIYYKGLLMGMSKSDVNLIIGDIIEFCELGDYFDLPIYMYSSGMTARLGFALAIFTEHDILIVDEVFAVGDKNFREKSSKKMEELFKSGKSIIFSSHSDSQIRQFCNRAIFIDESTIIVDGTVDEALTAYNKKYSPSETGERYTEFKNKFDKSNDFMQLIDRSKQVDYVGLLREIAKMQSYDEEYESAYYYMNIARELKPTGKIIADKAEEYRAKIGDVIIDYKGHDSTIKNLDKMINLINNRTQKFGKVELYRELGVFFELEGNLQDAYKYMSLAKELRPNGPFIIKKCSEYEARLEKYYSTNGDE